MTMVNIPQTSPAPRRLPWGARLGRVAYVLCSWALVGAILFQVFFAGLALMADPKYLDLHYALGGMIGMLLVGMIPVALLGRLGWRITTLTAATYGLYTLQYALIEVPRDLGIIELRALHPVNALVMFWLATYLVRRSRQRLGHG